MESNSETCNLYGWFYLDMNARIPLHNLVAAGDTTVALPRITMERLQASMQKTVLMDGVSVKAQRNGQSPRDIAFAS